MGDLFSSRSRALGEPVSRMLSFARAFLLCGTPPQKSARNRAMNTRNQSGPVQVHEGRRIDDGTEKENDGEKKGEKGYF